MLRPRFVKVMRDLTSDYTRSALLVLAIFIGVFGVGSILGGYAVLVREMARNYLGTAPASMTIKVEDAALDKGIVREVEGLPGVLRAERHATIAARMRVGEDWYPLLLFVIDDFDAMKTNKFRRITGAWPPIRGHHARRAHGPRRDEGTSRGLCHRQDAPWKPAARGHLRHRPRSRASHRPARNSEDTDTAPFPRCAGSVRSRASTS